MQIILPKKLSTAMKVDPIPMEETVNPLFNWTAHWTNTWDDKPTPDLLVLSTELQIIRQTRLFSLKSCLNLINGVYFI